LPSATKEYNSASPDLHPETFARDSYSPNSKRKLDDRTIGGKKKREKRSKKGSKKEKKKTEKQKNKSEIVIVYFYAPTNPTVGKKLVYKNCPRAYVALYIFCNKNPFFSVRA